VLTKFRSKLIVTEVCNIAKKISSYQENKMLQAIKTMSPSAYEYLVGEEGIAASKWISTAWLRDRSLPPWYGITCR
jgi:hypothetical protein